MTKHEEIRQIVNKALWREGLELPTRLLRQNPGVVIDIGANIGGFIPHWLANGATKVHAFEPVPWVFKEMQATYGKDKRCVLNEEAISDVIGVVKGVQICNAHTLAKPGEAKLPLALEDRGPFDMVTVSLDHYVKRKKIDQISLIKLDVDGYEFHALRGMSDTVYRTRAPIMIELSFLPRHIGQSCEHMVTWIYSAGYKLCTLNGEVCEDPVLVMEAYPWRTSFDMVAVAGEKIPNDWPRIR